MEILTSLQIRQFTGQIIKTAAWRAAYINGWGYTETNILMQNRTLWREEKSPWLSESRVGHLWFFVRSFSVPNIAEKSLTWLCVRSESTCQCTHTHSHICASTHMNMYSGYACLCVCISIYVWILIPFISYSLLVQSCCLLVFLIQTKTLYFLF